MKNWRIILSCGFFGLGEQVNMLEKAGADMLHIDVMDEMFCSQLVSFGSVILNVWRERQSFPLIFIL